MATDPVCGMTVEESADALRLVRDNRTYYFCCHECLRVFAEPEEAQRRLGRRLAVAWPCSAAVVVLLLVPAIPRALDVAAILAAVVQGYAGAGFYRGAWDALRRRVGNMDLLIATGSTAAFLYSVVVLAAPGRLPPATYFDASSLIVTIILTGNYLEQRTRRRAGSALRQLAELLPTTVTLLDVGGSHEVPLDEVRPGDRIRVAPGARFPADGVVRDGRSSVDESLLTGESVGARRGPGDRVLAGSQNREGPLTIEVTSAGSDTFVAHVGELLLEAEMSRVPLQRQADRIAALFVPFVLVLAIAAGGAWYLLAGAGASIGLLVFVTVAVTACPCAFGLATPAALLVGTGRAAEAGVLFRGGDAVERAATVDTVLLDKTGTLTSSEPTVRGVLVLPPISRDELLRSAAGLEGGIDHPLARAITEASATTGGLPARFRDVRLDPGRGVVGTAGSSRFELIRGDAAQEEGVDLAPVRGWARDVERDGSSWTVLLRDGRPMGAIAFEQPIAPGAAEAVRLLGEQGVRMAIVTGDHERAARRVAGALAIDDVHAGVSPEGKVALVRQYREQGRHVAFVGDGINDAAALAAADLGIAIGSGSEVARETGQVLLVRSDLRGVPLALGLARRIVGRVRGNLLWALAYNAVLLPIAAGALVPALGLGVYRFLPVAGAVAMGLSSTTVLLNSLTLRRDPGAKGRAPAASLRARPAAEGV